MPVLPVVNNDIQELVLLINSAYRGEASKKGWTTEADLIEGELRTDISTLTHLLNNPDAVMLKYTNPYGSVLGCVFLEKRERGLYLGMLTVSPLEQANGIGKKLLLASEVFAKENNSPCIFMNVIPQRHELVAWYERNGYHKTGETNPFPADHRFGKPTQPLEFIIMKKDITGFY